MYYQQTTGNQNFKKYVIYNIFKNMQYLRINQTKDVQDLHFEICKTLLEKLKI